MIDNIIYIKNGRIIADEEMNALVGTYRVVAFDSEPQNTEKLIGMRREKSGYSALIKAADASPDMNAREATLEEIMLHMEREG